MRRFQQHFFPSNLLLDDYLLDTNLQTQLGKLVPAGESIRKKESEFRIAEFAYNVQHHFECHHETIQLNRKLFLRPFFSSHAGMQPILCRANLLPQEQLTCVC
jgi:hypothetical protein